MRMDGVSCLRRPSADGDHTHALVAEQSQSFPDNLVALLGHCRAWNCSAQNAWSAAGMMMGSLYVEIRVPSAAFSRPAESTHSSQGLEAQILSHSQAEVGLGVEGSLGATRPKFDILRVILDRGES